MSHPVGPLLRTLAERVLLNLQFVEHNSPHWGGAEQDAPPYSDTQLLVSLLGVLVFPHERTPDALGKLLSKYGDLSRVVTVRYPKNGAERIEVTDAEGHTETIDPTSVKGLPRFLRNSIAHFNMLPIEKHGRFGGVRVWNENDDGEITLVADLDFDALRPFAYYVLQELADEGTDTGLTDPPDPLDTLAKGPPHQKQRQPKPPGLPDPIWTKWLAAHNGDRKSAKEALDRLVNETAKRLLMTGLVG
jgi:hypothetical protein